MESKRGDTSKTESTKCHKCKQAGNLMRDCPQRDPIKETNANNKEKPNRGILKCYKLCADGTRGYSLSEQCVVL